MDVGRLPAADRIAIARLSGIAARHGNGCGETDNPVAELRAVSQDPVLLAVAAAPYLLDAHRPPAAWALSLLRDVGADEQVLAEHAEQVREWRGRRTWENRPL